MDPENGKPSEFPSKIHPVFPPRKIGKGKLAGINFKGIEDKPKYDIGLS